ncbi:MAG: hypothetical protein PHU06_09540 [Gallionella sp.]|nr:hypothetical protein [Gallionella sp.]MDD4958787.1 hypothetical protein [Gallionella sp.]
MEQFTITADEGKMARWPHEIFLINLIFNHVLIFCISILLSKSYPLAIAIVPISSFIIIGYIELKSRAIAASNAMWFVKAHWQIGARRNRIFMALLSVTCIISGGGIYLSAAQHWNAIATKALIGGFGLLPFMVALLILVVLGNDSVYQARDGKLPDNYLTKNPHLKST